MKVIQSVFSDILFLQNTILSISSHIENEIKTNEEVNRQAEKTLQGSENLNSTSNELNQLVQKIDMEIERIK